MSTTSASLLLCGRRALRAFGLLALLPCLAVTLSAQSSGPAAGGTIIGEVTNGATGDILGGAVVTVLETGAKTYTQMDGTYTVRVPAGSHTLKFEYTGLDTSTLKVNVAAGAVAVADEKLTSEVYKMQPVTVSSMTESNAAALQEQRELISPTEIVPTDAFGIPAANPGVLLETLPEVSIDQVGSTVRTIYVRGLPSNFTTFMQDGNVMAASAGSSISRQFQTEQYNTSDLREIQLVYEPTPDMDGDEIGGVVNFITKRSFDLPDELQLTAATNWVDFETKGYPAQDNPGHADVDLLYNHTFSVFGGHRNLGIQVNVSENTSADTLQDEQGALGAVAGTSDLFPGFSGNTTAGPIQIDVGHGFIFYDHPLELDGGLDIDYKFDSGATLSLRQTYNNQSYNQYAERWWTNVAANYSSFVPGSTTNYEVTLPTAATAHESVYDLTKKSNNYLINPEFVDTVDDGHGTLDVNLAYSYAKIWYPGYQYVTATDPGTGWTLNRVGQDAYTPLLTQTNGPSYSSPSSYLPTAFTHLTYRAPDTIAQARIDYTQTLDTAPFSSFLKTGVKYSNDDSSLRTGETSETVFTGPTNQGITPWLGADYVMDGEGPYPFVNIPGRSGSGDASKDFAESYADAFNSAAAGIAGTSRFQEDLDEAYVEGSATYGPLTLLAGVRVEHSIDEAQQRDKNFGVTANAALTPAQNAALAVSQYTVTGTYPARETNYLPGIFATYKPWDNTLVKASYNLTVTRPPISFLLPNATVNPVNQSISVGNPGLQPYTAQNFDVSVSQYFDPVGEFEAGAWLKEIKNYDEAFAGTIGTGQFPALDAVFNPLYAGYSVSTYQTLGSARFEGCYFAYQQHFTMLPGLLSGLGLFGNVSFTNTEGNYGGAVIFENLTEMTHFQANYGISYVRLPVQLWLNANTRGQYLLYGTQINTSGAVITPQRTLLSLSGDYVFSKRWDAFFNVANLTDEPMNGQVVDRVPYGTELEGIGFTVGFRYKFQ